MKKFYTLPMALMLAALPAIAAPAMPVVTIQPQQRATVNPALFGQAWVSNTNKDAKKAPAKADEAPATMTVGHCGDPATANALQGLTGKLGVGVGFHKEQMASFAGNKIEYINVAAPVDYGKSAGQNFVNSLTKCTVYLMESLNGPHLCETETTIGIEGFQWNKIKLATPYEITGDKDLYVGIVWENVTANDLYFVFDNNQATSDMSVMLYSKCTGELNSSGNLILGSEEQWVNFSQLLGINQCISVDVTGENLPHNMAQIAADSYAPTITPNEPFTYAIGFINQGANTITDVDFELTIEGQEPQTAHANVTYIDGSSKPVNYNDAGMAAAQFTCTSEGMEVPFTARITKVNGEDNTYEAKLTGTFRSLSEGYPQNVVVEELTSTRCSACPVGITGMERTKKKYGADGRFIPIAVHSPIPQTGDPMNVCSGNGAYVQFMNDVAAAQGGASAPASYANRDLSNNIYPTPENLEDFVAAYQDALTLAEVKPTITKVDGNEEEVTLNVTVNASLDSEIPYGISYTIVEDNVINAKTGKMYSQTNGYSGAQYSAYGWENQPQSVAMKFNDVARNGSSYLPVAESYVSGLKAGEPYTFSTTVNLKSVNDKSQYSIVAMLINRKNNQIVNAGIVQSPDFSGVDSVVADEAALVAVGLEGAVDMLVNGSIYTIDGRAVATNVEGMVEVPAGIYLVATSAGNAKVIVR